MIKYDKNGNQSTTWPNVGHGPGVRRFNYAGSSNDVAADIALDLNGNIYVTGTTNGNATGLDVLTIKIRPDGTIVQGDPNESWPVTYNLSGNNFDEVARAIATDSEGAVIVTGYGREANTPGADKFLTIRQHGPCGRVTGWRGPVETSVVGGMGEFVDIRQLPISTIRIHPCHDRNRPGGTDRFLNNLLKHNTPKESVSELRMAASNLSQDGRTDPQSHNRLTFGAPKT